MPSKNTSKALLREFAVFAAVASFAAYSSAAFLRARYQPAPVAVVAPAKPFSRQLASLEGEAPAIEKSTKIIEIGCLGKGAASEVIKTEANLARIMAQDCSVAKNVAARNETTGENLMVFQQSKKISTHYFPLRAGANKIVINWLDQKGIKGSEVLQVDRSAN